jgi:biotin-(acetyl-CoA carboxylase) ligase
LYLFERAGRADAVLAGLVVAGAEDGTVVLAENGSDVAVAVLLRPDVPLRAAPAFAALAALALAEAVDAGAPTSVEATLRARGADWVIVGAAADGVADPNAFAATFLGGLDRWCARYAAEGPAALLAAWGTRKRPSREETSDARQ